MVRVLLLLLLLLVPLSANAGSLVTTKYDDHFKDAALFLPLGTDWRLLKAQCYQESRLDPFAVSPVGAFGLCQFMPATAKYMKKRHPELGDFWLAETSILAAAKYMNQMNNFWTSPRSRMDRYMLALASYNAGAGHLVKAQKLCGMPAKYTYIIKCLPQVTGRHSKETIGYVRRIIGEWYVGFLFD